MDTTSSLRIVVVIAALAAISITTVAQTQNQNPQNQNPQSQNQTQPAQGQNPSQNQAQPSQAQPQQKPSFWQKMKQSALQGMQNTTQQGAQQAQQGVQGVSNGVQQGAQTLQQGAQQAVAGGNSGNAAFGGSSAAGACGPTCFNAGPFLANVSQMTLSQEGPWHVIRMNLQFQNTTNQPLIIAYHDGSMIMTDNNGSTYQGAGGNPGELQGMGIDRGAQTDPQFVLNPGQTGNAMFAVARGRPANSPIGTGYGYNLTIDELQTQNGATAIIVRSYNLNFPSLTPGTTTSLTPFSSGTPRNAFTGGSTAASSAATGGTALSTGTANIATSPASGGTIPARTTGSATASSSTVVTNAAMKSTVGATAKTSAAVKPIPATTPVTANKATTKQPNPSQTPSTTH